MLRSCGYTWNEVASALQVSQSTIWRRLREAGIHDDELDSVVSQFESDLRSTVDPRSFMTQRNLHSAI